MRTADQQITVKTGIYKGVIPSKTVGKIPILRGVCSFIDSLYLGMKTLMFSADLFAEESEKELEERLQDGGLEADSGISLDRLPDDVSDTIRLVRIGDYDVCPCIGKHVRSTSQIGRFEMLGTNWDEHERSFRVRFKIV